MGTTLTYNGVTLRECETLRFSQTCQLDESGTDLVHHVFQVRVAAIVQADMLHFAAAQPPSGAATAATAGEAQKALRRALMHPHGDLEYLIGSTSMLKVTGNPQTAKSENVPLDARNGPFPRDFSIVHVAGERVFRVEFEIEANVVECGAPDLFEVMYGQKGTQNVLSNRWSLEDTKDENWYTTRHWEGTLRVAHSSILPHSMRMLVIPPLQTTFQRQSMRFTQTADGLNLKYSITDKQMHKAPPPPAVKWSATHVESTGIGGAIGVSNLTVQMEGPPGSTKGALLAAAARVVQARIGNLQKNFAAVAGSQQTDGFILQSASIIDQIHANTIELRVEVKQVRKLDTYLNTFFKKLDEPLKTSIPNYDDDVWPVPPAYDGKTPAGVFATYLQTPCNAFHSITGAVPITPQDPGLDKTSKKPDYTPSGDLPSADKSPGYSLEQTGKYPYTYIEIDNEYVTYEGVLHMPVARAANADPGGATSVFVSVCPPLTKRIFTMKAERVGAWPTFPKPAINLTDPNQIQERLLSRRIIPETPKLTADGRTLLYCVQCEYEYGLSRTPTPDEQLRASTSPIDLTTAATNTVQLSLVAKPNGEPK